MITQEYLRDRGLIKADFCLAYNPKLIPRAKELRKNMTSAEVFFWKEILKSKEFSGVRFLRQRVIDNYIVDFYCAKQKLVIEIDGEIHEQQKEYDEARTKALKMHGLEVLRYKNCDVFNNTEKVKRHLMSVLKIPLAPF